MTKAKIYSGRSMTGIDDRSITYELKLAQHQQMSDLKRLLDNEPSPIPSAPPIPQRKRHICKLDNTHSTTIQNRSSYATPTFSPAVISASVELSVKPAAIAELSGFCGDPDHITSSTLTNMMATSYNQESTYNNQHTLTYHRDEDINQKFDKNDAPFYNTRQSTRRNSIEDSNSLMPTAHQFTTRTFFRPESCKSVC
ncbi:hypothetical protein GJ496_010378 [Pomphorhynchus laevis]|nr:hypothetical protein GJ496_010378 [Pomphorhynchus laevis]